MRIGSASSVITPVGRTELAGYGYFLGRNAETVESPLTAHALAIEGNGQRAALCSVDLISVDGKTVSKISENVQEQLDTEGEKPVLLINASHTHSGPASYPLLGAGGHNPAYVDEILVPRLTETIVSAFRSSEDGEIGIKSSGLEGYSYDRNSAGKAADSRVTAIQASTESQTVAGAHFPCHPVVYGKNSRVVSSEYPGVARSVLREVAQADSGFWLTGSCADIDPIINKESKGKATRADKEFLGLAVGARAAELYSGIQTMDASLSVSQTAVEVPLDTAFELDPAKETELYREARSLVKSHDLSPLQHWLEIAAPIINGNQSETITVPVTLISLGKLVFAGFGAEIYSETGEAIESDHPELDIVTMMNSNEHQGYIPPAREYEADTYAARSSAFIFGRKPLTAASEQVFKAAASEAIEDLVR